MYLFIFSPRTSFIYYFDLMDSNWNYLSARERRYNVLKTPNDFDFFEENFFFNVFNNII